MISSSSSSSPSRSFSLFPISKSSFLSFFFGVFVTLIFIQYSVILNFLPKEFPPNGQITQTQSQSIIPSSTDLNVLNAMEILKEIKENSFELTESFRRHEEMTNQKESPPPSSVAVSLPPSSSPPSPPTCDPRGESFVKYLEIATSPGRQFYPPNRWKHPEEGFQLFPQIISPYVANSPHKLLMVHKGKFVIDNISWHPPEIAMNLIMEYIFKQFCQSYDKNKKNLVIDVGSNEGYFAMKASAYGCRSIAIEPQEECQLWMNLANSLNSYTYPPVLIKEIVAASPGTSVHIPKFECAPPMRIRSNANVNTEKTQPPPGSDQKDTVLMHSTTMDDILLDNPKYNIYHDVDILLWHLDVEGGEENVLRSAEKIIETKEIQNIVIECSTNIWHEHKVTLEQGAKIITDFVKKKHFECRSLNEMGNQIKSIGIANYHKFNIFERVPYSHDELFNYLSRGVSGGQDDLWCTTLKKNDITVLIDPELEPNDNVK